MIKLYKQSGDSLYYWEAWQDGGVVTTHMGQVGKQGEITHKKVGRFTTPEKLVAKLSQAPRRDGYSEIPLEEHWTLTIQQIMTDDHNADLDHRNDLIDRLNNALGWIGSGHVDGGDIGSGTVNIFAFIVAPDQTTPAVLEWLKESGELSKSTVALDSPDGSKPTTVIWPRDFEGQFSILGN